MTARRLGALLLCAAFLLPGCFIIDSGHLDELRDGSNGGVDSGPQPASFDDGCGADPPMYMLSRTTQSIIIDTTSMSNDLSTTCGGAATLGNDAFLAVNAQAGEYWHFHLVNDPTDPASVSRQPALYLLLQGSCDARDACTFSSDVCAGSSDEHFGFVANATGLWYLGIDDRLPGGSRYRLDAYRPVCGDGTASHGEACDDNNQQSGDGCSQGCLVELSMAVSPVEDEPNDNPTEANFLMLEANEFTVSGDIGGSGNCRYEDNFAIDVPPGASLEVDVLESDGSVCNDPALTANYRLSLDNSAFMPAAPSMTIAGCSAVRSGALIGGLYYLVVSLPAETDSLSLYRLHVRVVP